MKAILLVLLAFSSLEMFPQNTDQSDSLEVTDSPIGLTNDSVDVGELDADVYKLKRDFKSYQNMVDLKLNMLSVKLKKASNYYFAGIGVLVGSSLLYVVGGSSGGSAFAILGGVMSFSGIILNVSAWNQFNKASEILAEK